MEIPVRVILAVAAFFTLVLSVLGVLVWRTRRTYPGCTRWAIANVLFALSVFLVVLRPFIPDFIGVVGENAAVAVATILLLEATRQYCGLRPRVFAAHAGAVVAVLAVIYFDYVVININARVVAVSAFMGLVTMLCGVTLFREWRGRGRIDVVVGAGVFAITAALLIARAIYFLFAPPLTDLLAPTLVNSAFLIGCGLSITCCSIGWIQLTHDRVLMDLKNAENGAARANREVAEATERADSMAQRAATADALRSGFLETMNHEIRNPLGGVLAVIDLLLDTHLTPEQHECALLVRVAAETLLKVNDDLLYLSEIEAGKVVIESSGFDLRGVIEAAAKSYAHVARDKNIDLAVDYGAGIPHRFRGDAGRIRRVVMNLVWNAVRFTSSGQILVAVACEARESYHARMRVSVTDSGNGLPPETVVSLFEVYGDGPTRASRIQGGAGIGLVVSKKLTELMGGRLQVESQVGKGSKFWVTMPLTIETGAQ